MQQRDRRQFPPIRFRFNGSKVPLRHPRLQITIHRYAALRGSEEFHALRDRDRRSRDASANNNRKCRIQE